MAGDSGRAPLAGPGPAAPGVRGHQPEVIIVFGPAPRPAVRGFEHNHAIDPVVAYAHLETVLQQWVLPLDRGGRDFGLAWEGNGEAALWRLKLYPLHRPRGCRRRRCRLVLGSSDRGPCCEQEHSQHCASHCHGGIPHFCAARIDILADPQGSPTLYPWGEDFSAFSYIASTSSFSARRESGRGESMGPPGGVSTGIRLAPSSGGSWFTR